MANGNRAIEEAPINRIPGALLGWLDIKSMGKSPSYVGDRVVPTNDMEPFYMAGSRQFRGSLVMNMNAVGDNISNLVVPQNKAWLVESVVAYGANLTAGQALQFAIAIFNPNNQLMLAGDLSPIFAPNDLARSMLRFTERYVVLTPGMQFGALVTRIAAGPIQCTVSAAITECDY